MLRNMVQAITKWVLDGSYCPSKPFLTLIPMDSMEDFYLPLTAFDLTAESKNGCGGLTKLCSRYYLMCFEGLKFCLDFV